MCPPPSARSSTPSSAQRGVILDIESMGLLLAAGAFTISTVVAIAIFWGRSLTISGRGSLGEFIAIAGAATAVLAFGMARVWLGAAHSRSPAVRRQYRWLDMIALAAAHGAIAMLGWVGVAAVFQRSFVGATLYPTPAAIIAGAAVAVTAYASFLSGSNASSRQLSLVLAVFLVVGIVTAMLSSEDPLWWQKNLSALGITRDISALSFNLTVLIAGILVTTIAKVGTAGLPAGANSDRRKVNVVRLLFVLIGIFLACVGLFPVDRFYVLHNTVATGMTAAFAAIVLSTPWLMPSLPPVFIVSGFVFVAVILFLGILFAVGIYNLTAVELIASLVIFAWIILFLRNVQPEREGG